jgi:hypothetical protein
MELVVSYGNDMRSVAGSRAGEGRREYLHRILQREENLWMMAMAYGYQTSSCPKYRADIAALEIDAGVMKTLPEILDQMDACIEENERIEFYWHQSVE